jgi:type II secretory pathway predicted ATPase ExeA
VAESINPYRHDLPGVGPFVGRSVELDELRGSIVTGRNALAAVMGGRGIGKTALAARLRKDLAGNDDLVVRVVERVDPEPGKFVGQLERRLGASIDPVLFIDDLVRAVQAQNGRRVVLLLDEIDELIGSEEGHNLLSNLRIGYEMLGGTLAVVVFGGSRLRQLLTSGVSPFLRTARWYCLAGLSLSETTALVNEPLSLHVPPEAIEALWDQTGGHPLLLQAVMELAVDAAASSDRQIVDELQMALVDVTMRVLEPRVFPIWWDNLTERGQRSYRTLSGMKAPLARHEWAAHLGNDPDGVVEILRSTGVARVEGGRLLARSALFCEWVNRCYPLESLDLDEMSGRESGYEHPDASIFERFVVDKVARWARSVIEHPAPFLRLKSGSDDNDLGYERNFQLGLLYALRTHDLFVEPEPLSAERGRVDLKVRPFDDASKRACIEVKLWGRNHKGVVQQILDYVVDGDEFACVVMVDHRKRSLREPYLRECSSGHPTPSWEAEPGSGAHPALLTEHGRASGAKVRVYHFLIQLPR